MKKKIETIDCTPTWEGVLPLLIEFLDNKKLEVRQTGNDNLLTISRMADAFNKACNDGKIKISDYAPYGIFVYSSEGENECLRKKYAFVLREAVRDGKDWAKRIEENNDKQFVEVWEKDKEGLWGNTGEPIYKSDV